MLILGDVDLCRVCCCSCVRLPQRRCTKYDWGYSQTTQWAHCGTWRNFSTWHSALSQRRPVAPYSCPVWAQALRMQPKRWRKVITTLHCWDSVFKFTLFLLWLRNYLRAFSREGAALESGFSTEIIGKMLPACFAILREYCKFAFFLTQLRTF